MSAVPRPDLSERPLQTRCDRLVHASPADVYAAWTRRFDAWFAQPGTLVMVPEPGRPYFFYSRDDWGRHPHYGRFLATEADRLVEMTWVTGDPTGSGSMDSSRRGSASPRRSCTEVHFPPCSLPTTR